MKSAALLEKLMSERIHASKKHLILFIIDDGQPQFSLLFYSG
jgi:hypothetical protein